MTSSKLSKTLETLLQNQEDPEAFIKFIFQLFLALGLTYQEVLSLFHSKYFQIHPDKEFSLTEPDFRMAWIKVKENKNMDIVEKELEWFFLFCRHLGFSYFSIVKMVHSTFLRED